MTHDPPDRRRYSDQEVKKILERATELQAQGPGGSDSSASGLTLDELQEVAREAGIDPALIRRAADDLEMGAPPPDSWGGFLGAPSQLRCHRIVEGEVPTGEMDALVSIIESVVGAGEPRLVGRTLSWSTGDPERKLRLTIETRDGRTLIRADEQLNQLAGGLFGGIIGGVGGGVGFGVGMGVGIGALGSALFATLFPLGVVAASWAGARKIFTSIAGKRRREMERIVDGIAEAVSARAAERSLESGEDDVSG